MILISLGGHPFSTYAKFSEKLTFLTFVPLERHAERNHGNSYDGDNDFEICFASKLPSKLPVMSSWTKVNKQNKMF